MKYAVALFCLLFLAACAPQYAPPQQYPPPQYPPQYMPPQQIPPQQMPPQLPQQMPPVYEQPPMEPEAKLGATKFTIHPYTVGNREAASARPGTPLVGKLIVSKALPHNPPVTDDVTIFITVVYPDGKTEVFGTDNVPNVPQLNILRYDPSPDVQAWTNDKFIASAEIDTDIDYVVFVNYHGDNRYIIHRINVR
jgi:hypothetical protein